MEPTNALPLHQRRLCPVRGLCKVAVLHKLRPPHPRHLSRVREWCKVAALQELLRPVTEFTPTAADNYCDRNL